VGAGLRPEGGNVLRSVRYPRALLRRFLVYQIGAIFFGIADAACGNCLLHANCDQPWQVAAYVAAAEVIGAICAGLIAPGTMTRRR
jgi:hypothetical protein